MTEKTQKDLTSIQISQDLWEKLNSLKTSERKTFEDVILRLLRYKAAYEKLTRKE